MKLFLFAVFVALVGVIESAPGSSATSDRDASVLRSESVVSHDGFNFVYETNNGIAAQSSGALEGDALAVHGGYQYTSPEGVPVKVSYVADDEGYKPSSDLLPVPPPTPEAILRGLQYIAAHPPPVETYKKL